MQPRHGRKFGKGFVCFMISEIWWFFSRVKKLGTECVTQIQDTELVGEKKPKGRRSNELKRTFKSDSAFA